MLEGSIALTLSGATNSKFKALSSVWLPDYYVWQLQFKILHTRVATNKYLNKIGINNSGLCDNCKVAVVTIEHLFLDCQNAVNF